MSSVNKIKEVIGLVLFWVAWPLLWVYLRLSRRTRLLLVCNNEFLILRGYLGSRNWGLPGGGLHKGEDPIEGLIREVYEETAIKLYKQDVKFVFSDTYKSNGFRFEYDCFVAELSDKPDVRIQKSEIAEYKWTTFDDTTTSFGSDVAKAVEQWKNK